MLGTHSTGEEQFNESYVENSHLQRSFNEQIVKNFIDYILRTIPNVKEKRIKILDLCCGDGGVTSALFYELTRAGISIEKMVGYDISSELIDIAKKYENENLKFQIQDLKKMDDQEEYDIVLSLFGLHWIDDIDCAAHKIYQSLKSDGKLMYFVPLEKAKLFVLREAVINSPEFQELFKDYSFSPFRSNPEEYFQAFQIGFESENSTDEISSTVTKLLSPEKFKEFLASWMQELRHLQSQADVCRYLDKLFDNIPTTPDPCHDVEINDQGEVIFHERIHWFFGTKRQREQAVNVSEQPANVSKKCSSGQCSS